MAYYLQRGDYGAGYMRQRGDPGLLSVLGGAVKGLVGFATGGPVGAITALMPRGQPPVLQGQGPFMPGVGIGIGTSTTGIRIGTFAQQRPGTAVATVPQAGACPAGFHLDKRTQSKCVRNRSMNPANPRALRRAIRREHGFVALAKRTLRGTGVTVTRSKSFASKRRARPCGCK